MLLNGIVRFSEAWPSFPEKKETKRFFGDDFEVDNILHNCY